MTRAGFARATVIVLATSANVGIATTPDSSQLLPDRRPRLSVELAKAIETRGIDAAVARYRKLRELGFDGVRESESDTNDLGYRFLRRGDTTAAIQVFRLNVETHPDSANVHDSLGEAYVAAGDEALAIESYYLVATSWLTVARRTGSPGMVDLVALVIGLGVAAGLVGFGLQAAGSPTGTRAGVPAAPFFVFGAVALLAAAGDLRMIARRGVSGRSRITRHLWRMCTALFIAVGSLFLGQPQVFPYAVRHSGLLPVPGLLVLGALAFWLIRVRFTRPYGTPPVPRQGGRLSPA